MEQVHSAFEVLVVCLYITIEECPWRSWLRAALLVHSIVLLSVFFRVRVLWAFRSCSGSDQQQTPNHNQAFFFFLVQAWPWSFLSQPLSLLLQIVIFSPCSLVHHSQIETRSFIAHTPPLSHEVPNHPAFSPFQLASGTKVMSMLSSLAALSPSSSTAILSFGALVSFWKFHCTVCS